MEKNLALHCHSSDGLAHSYLGDSPRLRQVLLNLVINAIKFTERGAVSITAVPADSEDQSLRIEVADTGVGIPREMQAQIFEPFTRLESQATGAEEEGTGLGLDIVRRNIEAMGGRIGVASSPGVGSTFWIELPLEACESGQPQAAAHHPAPSAVERFTGRVLLVDDNETNLMLGSMILEGMGVAVMQANSGELAVATALDAPVDLVLMDISMPGMDGYEATRLIREERSADDLPVVALTAYASSEERRKSEAVGMNDYLTKPIERGRLVEVLSRWMVAAPEAPTAAGDSEGVDREVLDSMRDQIGLENLNTVIGKFCVEAGDRWQALASAGSSADLAREAHTLGSTCRSFGLPSVADSLKDIERAAKSGAAVADIDELAAIGTRLEAGLRSLQATLQSLQGR
jgi:CheY-like chemotaxis protein